MKKLEDKTNEQLNTEYNNIQEEKEEQYYDQVVCEVLQEQQDKITNVIMDRKEKMYIEEIDDEHGGYNDIGSSGISI